MNQRAAIHSNRIQNKHQILESTNAILKTVNPLVKMDWNNDLVETLINAVQNKDLVWNKGHALYQNKNPLESAWVEIANLLGLEERPTCVKGKWYNL